MTFEKKDRAKIVAEMLANMVKNSVVNDVNVGSVLRTLIESIALQIDELYEQAEDIYKAAFVDTATGEDLEKLGKLVGIERLQGSKAEGYVTFIASSAPASDITIPAGKQVSTTPNTNEDQKIFVVKEDTVFPAQINDEEHIFIDGIWYYALNERLIDSIVNLYDEDGNNYTEGTDFQVSEWNNIIESDTKVIHTCETRYDLPNINKVVIDSCDSDTDWNVSNTEGSISVNNTAGSMKEGTACLNLSKTSGSETTIEYYKTTTTFDFTNDIVYVWYYIADATKINDVRMKVGSDSSNYYYNDFTPSNGWNLLAFFKDDADGSTGSPDVTNCDYIALEITYANASTEVSGDEQRMDFWHRRAAPQIDTTDKKQGAASLRLYKSITTSTFEEFETEASSYVNCEERNVFFWLKNETGSNLSKIVVKVGADSNNYFKKEITNISEGWQIIQFNFDDADVEMVGTAYKSGIKYFAIQLYTQDSSTIIPEGKVKIDFIRASKWKNYEGNIIEWLESGSRPANNKRFYVSYKPKSKEVLCQAADIGETYNVAPKKINYMVTSINGISSVLNYEWMSGGTDVEDDDSLRERIIHASDAANKGTAAALEYNIRNISGIVSARVVDMPEKVEYNEPHVYVSGNDEYVLQNELVKEVIEVRGKVSGADYTFAQGTDYTVDIVENKIKWLSTGTNPDDGSIFYVDYKYNWLGHAHIFIEGKLSPIPTEIADQINEVIAETKPAGIVVTWSEPERVYVNVEIDVKIKSDIDKQKVLENVKTAISNYINSLEIGEDVLIAKIIDVVMEVEGVENCRVNIPTSDVSIDDDKIAKSANIIVNEM